MTKRETEVFAKGRMAFARHGETAFDHVGRLGPEMRKVFRAGIEEERRQRLAQKVTPEQRAEAEAAADALTAFRKTLLSS